MPFCPPTALLQDIFSTTTRFGKLSNVSATVSGRNLFVRFTCETSDAMGMNMVGKGVNKYASLNDRCVKFGGISLSKAVQEP
jgi:hydroxymethylglutaryl-CoA reductase